MLLCNKDNDAVADENLTWTPQQCICHASPHRNVKSGGAVESINDFAARFSQRILTGNTSIWVSGLTDLTKAVPVTIKERKLSFRVVFLYSYHC